MLTAALLALTLGADAGVSGSPRAVVLLASSPELFEKWARARPAERAKLKGLTEKVKIDERVLIAVALDGYELPTSRRVDVTADLVIVDSTGRTVLEKASVAFAKSFDPRTETALLLKSVGALLYGVTDPEGPYTAKLTIWDQIRGESYRSTSTFTVSR